MRDQKDTHAGSQPPVGARFKIERKTYVVEECLEGSPCSGCGFEDCAKDEDCDRFAPECESWRRDDGKIVRFVPAPEHDDGYVCQSCGSVYVVDVNVHTALLERIKTTGGGPLCGQCIMARIEALGEFRSFELRSIP